LVSRRVCPADAAAVRQRDRVTAPIRRHAGIAASPIDGTGLCAAGLSGDADTAAHLGTAAMPIPALGATGSQQLSFALVARFGRDAATQITNGLVWRIFPAKPDVTGTFRAIKEDKTASPVMALPPGDYVVHVSFGLASAAKALRLKEATRECSRFRPAASSLRVASAT